MNIMAHYLSAHANSNSFCAHNKNKRKLCLKGNRLLFAGIISINIFCNRRIYIQDIFCNRTKATLNITSCRCGVTSVKITKVSLLVNEQLFISKIYKSRVDRSISMRMISHDFSDNVGNLCEPSVISFNQSMNDTSLNRLKTVNNFWNSPVTDYVTCILNEILIKKIFNKCHFSHPANLFII